MPRNVVGILRRPRAVSLSRPIIQPCLSQRYQSSEQRSSSTNGDADHILRIADQRTLRDTKIQAAKFVSSINDLQRATSSLPTSIRSPDIRVPYTFGYVRDRVENVTPPLAQKTIDAVEKVRAHLTDLELEGYKDRKDRNTVVGEFERELVTWDEEKKMDTLRSLRLEEEARLVRLNESTQRLVSFVEEVLRRGSMKTPKQPLFAGNKSGAKEVSVETESDGKPAVKMGESEAASSSKVQEQPGLADLQKQLEANITDVKK